MVDSSEMGSDSEGINRKYSDGGGDSSIESPNDHGKKTCADCGTTKTPLWRGGPAGPKSLCNACGIRSWKKRRAVISSNKRQSSVEKKLKKRDNNGDGLKQRLWVLGREVKMQRSTVDKQRRKLGEEEQAAILLMALSYGSVVYG